MERHGYIRQNGLYKVVSENKESIAVFCHSGFGCTWFPHLFNIPPLTMWSGFSLATTSVTKVEINGNKG